MELLGKKKVNKPKSQPSGGSSWSGTAKPKAKPQTSGGSSWSGTAKPKPKPQPSGGSSWSGTAKPKAKPQTSGGSSWSGAFKPSPPPQEVPDLIDLEPEEEYVPKWKNNDWSGFTADEFELLDGYKIQDDDGNIIGEIRKDGPHYYKDEPQEEVHATPDPNIEDVYPFQPEEHPQLDPFFGTIEYDDLRDEKFTNEEMSETAINIISDVKVNCVNICADESEFTDNGITFDELIRRSIPRIKENVRLYQMYCSIAAGMKNHKAFDKFYDTINWLRPPFPSAEELLNKIVKESAEIVHSHDINDIIIHLQAFVQAAQVLLQL